MLNVDYVIADCVGYTFVLFQISYSMLVLIVCLMKYVRFNELRSSGPAVPGHHSCHKWPSRSERWPGRSNSSQSCVPRKPNPEPLLATQLTR